MKAARILAVIFCMQLFTSGVTQFAGAEATDSVSAQTRCTVCGMFVAKYPNWLSQIQYENPEQTKFFDGVKDMMVFYFNPEHYGGIPSEAIKNIYVKDYYSLIIHLTGCQHKMLFTWLAVMYMAPWDMNLFRLRSGMQQNHFQKITTAKKFLPLIRLLPNSLNRCGLAKGCADACFSIIAACKTFYQFAQKINSYAACSHTFHYPHSALLP